MFNGQSFYHESIKKAVIAFGTIFNGIIITRTNDADESQTLRVPLNFGPKQLFLARIQQQPNLEPGSRPIEITLPRIAFDISGIYPDTTRKLPSTNRIVNESSTGPETAFISTPYILGFSLSVMARNQEDGLQIVEQFLPYFSPDFSVRINELPELNVMRDLQITLDSCSYVEEYEGSFDRRLLLSWDFMFSMKINLWGHVAQAQLIRTAIQNLYNTNTGDGERVTVTTDPADATIDSAYGFLTSIETI